MVMLGGAAWQLCCHKHAHTRACARTRSLPRKPLCGLSVLQLLTQYSKLQRFQPVLHADAAPLEASVCMGGVGWWWCVGGEGGGTPYLHSEPSVSVHHSMGVLPRQIARLTDLRRHCLHAPQEVLLSRRSIDWRERTCNRCPLTLGRRVP